MNTDKVTTIAGAAAALLVQAQGSGFAVPADAQEWAQFVLSIVLFVLGYFTNRRGQVGATQALGPPQEVK